MFAKSPFIKVSLSYNLTGPPLFHWDFDTHSDQPASLPELHHTALPKSPAMTMLLVRWWIPRARFRGPITAFHMLTLSLPGPSSLLGFCHSLLVSLPATPSHLPPSLLHSCPRLSLDLSPPPYSFHRWHHQPPRLFSIVCWLMTFKFMPAFL